MLGCETDDTAPSDARHVSNHHTVLKPRAPRRCASWQQSSWLSNNTHINTAKPAELQGQNLPQSPLQEANNSLSF
jgi:hypothetical protein